MYKHLNVTGDPDLPDIDPFVLKKRKSRSFNGTTKLRRELRMDIEMKSIPLMELSSKVEYIHIKTLKASQNTDLDMAEFLGIDKALQRKKDELLNHTSKLIEINEHIKKEYQKLKEVENDPTYSEEQRQLCRDRLDDLNT